MKAYLVCLLLVNFILSTASANRNDSALCSEYLNQQSSLRLAAISVNEAARSIKTNEGEIKIPATQELTDRFLDDSPLTLLIENQLIYSAFFKEKIKNIALSRAINFKAEFPEEIRALTAQQIQELARKIYSNMLSELLQLTSMEDPRYQTSNTSKLKTLRSLSQDYVLKKFEEALIEIGQRNSFLNYSSELAEMNKKRGFFTKSSFLENYILVPALTLPGVLLYNGDYTSIIPHAFFAVVFSILPDFLGGDLKKSIHRRKLLKQIHINHEVTRKTHLENISPSDYSALDLTKFDVLIENYKLDKQQGLTASKKLRLIQDIYTPLTRFFISDYLTAVQKTKLNDIDFFNRIKESLRTFKPLSSEDAKKLKEISSVSSEVRTSAEGALTILKYLVDEISNFSFDEKKSLRDEELEELALSLTVQGQTLIAIEQTIKHASGIISGARKLEIAESAVLVNNLLSTNSTSYHDTLSKLFKELEQFTRISDFSKIE